ncbi:hypothetical protein GCM10027612_36380 [Microbispora bryophytorum subsp. camponoti]
MAVEWRFTPDDVARLRFAFSPMWELVASLRVLRAPGRHSLHLPWLRAVRPRLREADLRDLFALVPVNGYIPDFLTPPPGTPLPDFAAELERVRATPPATAYEEIVWVQTSDTAALRRFADDPAEGVRRVADQLRAYWAVAFEEFWPGIRALLEADVMWRARTLAAGECASCSPTCTRGSPGTATGSSRPRTATMTATSAGTASSSCRAPSPGRTSG